MHHVHGAGGDARGAYSCQPCTVDSRPEGVLRYEGAVPRGAKGEELRAIQSEAVLTFPPHARRPQRLGGLRR